MSCSPAPEGRTATVSNGAIIKCDKLYMEKEWHWVTCAARAIVFERVMSQEPAHAYAIWTVHWPCEWRAYRTCGGRMPRTDDIGISRLREGALLRGGSTSGRQWLPHEIFTGLARAGVTGGWWLWSTPQRGRWHPLAPYGFSLSTESHITDLATQEDERVDSAPGGQQQSCTSSVAWIPARLPHSRKGHWSTAGEQS